ncbi:MAG: GNAT family N-acetyltransferase [Neisseriaceae bacterium]|nr:GNAT family N-acetyltransferase [Neisseriaceae bacterium]
MTTHTQTDTPTLADEISWQPLSPILPKHIKGFYCTLAPLDAERHLDDLYHALCEQSNQDGWTYLAYGPFEHKADFGQWLSDVAAGNHPLFYAICDLSGRALGLVAYLAISLEHGSIEIGHVHFGHPMRRSRISTEAIYLMINQAFNLGFRRCEWKCDSMNQASAKSALRFGFQYEGLFRQHRVNRGRNRDTKWFSIIDGEWPVLQKRYLNWLNPKNFNDSGVQIEALNIAND